MDTVAYMRDLNNFKMGNTSSKSPIDIFQYASHHQILIFTVLVRKVKYVAITNRDKEMLFYSLQKEQQIIGTCGEPVKLFLSSTFHPRQRF